MKRTFVSAIGLVVLALASCGNAPSADAGAPGDDNTHTAPSFTAPDLTIDGDQKHLPTVQEVPLLPRATPRVEPLQNFSADAAVLVQMLPALHPLLAQGWGDYFAARAAEYTALARVPMPRSEFVMETQRFLAYFNDGHLSRTLQTIGSDSMFQHGDFLDAFFVARDYGFFLAEGPRGPATQYRVVSIGGVPIAEITALIDEYYGRYNNAGRLRNHARYARYELVLHMADARLVAANGNIYAELVLEHAGARHTRVVGFIPEHPSSYRIRETLPLPLTQHEMMGDILYVRFTLLDASDESTPDAIDAVHSAMERGVRDFIIDLRDAFGGDPEAGYQLLEAMGLTIPMHGKQWRINENVRNIVDYHGTHGLFNLRYFSDLDPHTAVLQDMVYVPRSPASANPHGVRVVALTGERTFSGGTTVATVIADGIFGTVIGEPPATGPSFYGWGASIPLERAGLFVRPHITFYLRPDENADQHTLWPDIFVDAWDALETALEWLGN